MQSGQTVRAALATLRSHEGSDVRRFYAAAIPLLALAGVLRAQASLPQVRTLGPEIARSTVTFGAVSQIVPLSGGRILVADASRRLVTLLDSTLGNPRTVLDSATGLHTSAVSGVSGGRGGIASTPSFLLPFRGDSALWFDGGAGVFLVLDDNGRIGRALAPPSTGASRLATGLGLFTSRSASGVLFRSPVSIASRIPEVAATGAGRTTWLGDSLVVLRMNFTTRAIDTLARQSWYSGHLVTRDFSGRLLRLSTLSALFPFHDEVAVTSDGTVAVFRAREYRIDWFDDAGQRLPGARLPYPWVRVSDDDRQRLLDSITAPRVRRYDSLMAARAADSARTGSVPTVTTLRLTADGAIPVQIPQPPPTPPTAALPEQIPDYLPPTSTKAFLADADNRVWIRPIGPEDGGGTVWHVVDRARGVVDRVRIPANATIAGFGPGGVTYVVTRDAGQATLHKYRL